MPYIHTHTHTQVTLWDIRVVNEREWTANLYKHAFNGIQCNTIKKAAPTKSNWFACGTAHFPREQKKKKNPMKEKLQEYLRSEMNNY